MKASGIEWSGVRVPFRRPFATSAGALAARFSLLIWVETDAGITGVGEAPSALGFGLRGLQRLEATVRRLAPLLIGTPAEKAGPLLQQRAGNRPDAPALRFAFETAAYDAIGQLEGRPLAALLGGRLRPLAVNAVIGASSPKETSGLAARAVAEGFGTIKLKVGGRPIEHDEAALRAVREAVGVDIKLRLDANRAWPLAEAVSNISRLAPFQIEYIEEPVGTGDPATLARVRESSAVPIAVDESVEDRDAARRIMDAGAADILVLKAARLGGLQESKATAEMAAMNAVRTVFTSSLETGVGLAASVHLAAALDSAEACGLATSALLEHDLLARSLLPREGLICMPELPGLGISIDREAVQHYGIGLEGRAEG